MFIRILLMLGIFINILLASDTNRPVHIFASGNNKFVLPTLLQNFYKKYPNLNAVVQYGSTGDLAESILNGVHYDIFLGADMKFAQKIYDAKKALYPPREYTRGSLILFVPADKTLNQKKIKILKDKKIKHITIANKKTAPYGVASIEVLENTKLFKSIGQKVRYSTDISTAITNVIWYDDAGFLSKSALHALPISYRKEGVNWIEIDTELYSPIIQGYVVSKCSINNETTMKFIDFLFSKEGRDIYKEYGYK